MTAPIDNFLGYRVWRDTPLSRLIPLAESASLTRHAAGDVLFKQFFPADQFSLLTSGSVGHEMSADGDSSGWVMETLDWPWAGLGWSGFLPPHRNGTTTRAVTQAELLTWHHDELAQIFYADPQLAVDFFRLVLDSVRRQFERAREERLAKLDNERHFRASAATGDTTDRHRFAPGLIAALRQSPFFEYFDDSALERIAKDAELVRCAPHSEIVRQGDDTNGLWVLAAGRALSFFSTNDREINQLDLFRSITGKGSILSGLPTIDRRYVAEATVSSTSACWLYRISADSIEQCIADDPEFGRSFMQRHLARLAHLITATRLPRPRQDEPHEIAAVRSVLEQNEPRIPVTSELHKIPHLLGNALTVGNVFACLNTVRKTGSYQEKAIARTCADLLSGMRNELHFFRDVLETYVRIQDAPDDAEPAALRNLCDAGMARAFGHLNTEIRGAAHLPESAGHIVIMNHLGCPAYYQLPNGYHFSFDTAFVSVLLQSTYGASPVRVVRESPGTEYGHNLFYRRLGHITVPTAESGIEAGKAVIDDLRRAAAASLFDQGRMALAQGLNVLICPEGQSQAAHRSPARFYSGAFRLALRVEPEPYIVPIAIAGFEKRYKDAKLVALVRQPFRLSEAMEAAGTPDLRLFLEHYRDNFAEFVQMAQDISVNGRDDAASPKTQYC